MRGGEVMDWWLVFVLMGLSVFSLVVFERAALQPLVVLPSGQLVERPVQSYVDCNLGQGLCEQYQKAQALTLLEHNN